MLAARSQSEANPARRDSRYSSQAEARGGDQNAMLDENSGWLQNIAVVSDAARSPKVPLDPAMPRNPASDNNLPALNISRVNPPSKTSSTNNFQSQKGETQQILMNKINPVAILTESRQSNIAWRNEDKNLDHSYMPGKPPKKNRNASKTAERSHKASEYRDPANNLEPIATRRLASPATAGRKKVANITSTRVGEIHVANEHVR